HPVQGARYAMHNAPHVGSVLAVTRGILSGVTACFSQSPIQVGVHVVDTRTVGVIRPVDGLHRTSRRLDMRNDPRPAERLRVDGHLIDAALEPVAPRPRGVTSNPPVP